MIKVLIIEDDNSKLKHIQRILQTIPELLNEDVSVATDLVEGRDLLSKRFYDLLILDIYLPPAKAAPPSPEAGIHFVRELRQSNSLIKPAHVIGLTAYEEGLTHAGPAFFSELWLLIKYDPTSTGWSNQLKSKVEYLLMAKKEMRAGENSTYDFDLGIITALWDPELNAVLGLPLDWSKRSIANDGTNYFVGIPKNRTPNLQVVAASCSQMGMASAAVLAGKMINHFRPRYLAIAGIAAGIKVVGVNLGDVLIAERSWDYESGKRRLNNTGNTVLVPDPHYIPINSELRDSFAECVGRKVYTNEIENNWSGSKPFSPLNAILGPVGSGAAVVEDQSVVADVKNHARKLIGIDMETYGVFYAAANCCKPRPKVFSIKSVVDFADDQKSDSAHEYAAFTSAQYLWRFAVDHFPR